MLAIMKKIQRNPKFPLVMAGASYTMLASASAGCLYWYFTQIASNDFWHWMLVSYCIMLANGITGFTEFFSEDSFCPLRDLLDHLQLVLVLPCYAAQMWVKTEMGPPEIAVVHAGLGIIAALMYILVECRRQDLTDLAIFANAFSLCCISLLNVNPFVTLATSVLVSGYLIYKRDDEQCCLAPQDKFNLIMATFAIISLVSFDDDIVTTVQDTVHEGLNAIIGGE
ncbi:uncharacterized protein LOC126743795 [Anthonomus grandis grandis]|uniref:uncharacterized protein LOC126743795 n=1 Tax=Anthonomus grandis grandis TaxID=2921223 RepID=UPI0021654738|nr:uncharacterized protein LOC126743795 [Anthonomus grandis grandis]